MPTKIVQHQALAYDWKKPIDIENPRTLVLGSFNPYNINTRGLDYYYGRELNYFWKTVANIIGETDTYFFHNEQGLRRKIAVMDGNFCCLDVIDKIEFSSINIVSLDDFLEKKIFSNFLDQYIWGTKLKYLNGVILLKRKYNPLILETLINSSSIKKVIHTMGNNRIKNEKFIYPYEPKLHKKGFRCFIKEIIKICEEKKIEFVVKSFSPSAYAVNNKYTDKNELKEWLKGNLYF